MSEKIAISISLSHLSQKSLPTSFSIQSVRKAGDPSGGAIVIASLFVAPSSSAAVASVSAGGKRLCFTNASLVAIAATGARIAAIGIQGCYPCSVMCAAWTTVDARPRRSWFILRAAVRSQLLILLIFSVDSGTLESLVWVSNSDTVPSRLNWVNQRLHANMFNNKNSCKN